MKELKKMAVALAAVGSAVSAMAFLYGDVSDAKHAWAVHDPHRANPAKVTPADVPGQPPSDAIVLFDGTQKSFEENWVDAKGGKTKWKFVNGTLESVRRAGNICSRRQFGDVQLHVEWQAPVKVQGFGQGRGNSGVFLLGGLYEVQVLDSYETDPANMKNPNYPDGQAGAVYGQNPPLVNPTRKPGEWQSYDIVFHQPVFEGDTCVHPGSLTVFLNGVLVQDHWELEGPTWYLRRSRQVKPGTTKGSIQFQDHGNPVHFRNVWVRELPCRYANTTHGTYLAKEQDVAALRKKTAATLAAKLDTKNPGNGIRGILEVLSYDKDGYWTKYTEMKQAYLDGLARLDAEGIKAKKGEIFAIRNDLNLLIRNKVFPENCGFRAAIQKIITDNGLDKK